MVIMVKFSLISIDCHIEEVQSHMKVNKYLFVTDREDMFIISRIKMVNFRQSQICSTKVKKGAKRVNIKTEKKLENIMNRRDFSLTYLFSLIYVKIPLHLINDY
jgi:hypothetical protein